MFSHIMVGANDVKAMVAFYDAVLEPLGLVRDLRQTVDSPAGFIWQRRDERWPQFAVRRPFNGRSATAGNGVQISFVAASREHVRTAWEAAVLPLNYARKASSSLFLVSSVTRGGKCWGW